MLGKIFAVLVSTSFIFGALTGRMEAVGNALIGGANEAVNLSISLLGIMCLWSGVIRVLDKAGFTKLLSRMISPLLRIMYPKSYKLNNGIDDVAASFAANLLGLGNAALPIGIRAMTGLNKTGLPRENVANDDMVMFAVLNTTPLQLMPTTLIAMRSVKGSLNPFEIITPIWICSVLTMIFGIIICKILAKIFR